MWAGEYVSQASLVQTIRVSCTVTVRFIKVGGYVIWHLHKTVLPTLLKKCDPGSCSFGSKAKAAKYRKSLIGGKLIMIRPDGG